MTRASTTLFSAVPLALLLAGCNPYDPQLGNTPFRCGMSAPFCPDGYTNNKPTTDPTCVCISGGDVGPDASTAFICADDHSLELNDVPARAFVTPIPSAGPSYSLLGLALCPSGDLDHFQFGVTANGTNLQASVVSVAGRPPLQLNLLASNGMVIATGLSDAVTPQKVNLDVPNRLAAGTYVIQVKSPDNGENNYDLSIKTCVTPLPCP